MKEKRVRKIFYLNGKGVEGFKKIGAWLWLQDFKISPPNQLEVALQGIGYMHEELKNPNINWDRLIERFQTYRVSMIMPKIVCELSMESFGELNTIKGMLMAGLSDLVAKTGKSISTSEVVSFCLSEKARDISLEEY